MKSHADALEKMDAQVAEIAHLPEPNQLDPLIAALVQYAKLTSRQGRWVLMGFAQGNAFTYPLHAEAAQVFKFPVKAKRKAKRGHES